MIIGGLQKNSLIDYPEKLSSVIFLSGCNFRCPYCQNPGLILPPLPALYDAEQVLSFLKDHKNFIDGVVISGGEPTCQSDLFSLCQDIKKLEYPIKLDTNGSNPLVVDSLVRQGLVDYIAMDLKTDPYAYESLSQNACETKDILQSIDIIQSSHLPYEFRTTCVKPFVTTHIMDRMISHIEGARLYVLQRFRPKIVLDSEFIQKYAFGFEDDEMLALKSIADSRVNACIIR